MVQNQKGAKPDLYGLLEVERTATAAQIKTSFKKLALVSTGLLSIEESEHVVVLLKFIQLLDFRS